MKWSAVGSVLSTLAPTIAAAAGGPLAGSAIMAIEGALGLHPGSTATLGARQDAAALALGSATPETLLALKKADNDFQAQMTSLGFADAEALSKLAVDDTASARAREITVRDHTPALLASGITTGFFSLLIFMCFRAVPPESKDLLNIMLGSLGTAWVSVVAYYFGSSNGSARKTELIAGATPRP